MASVKQLILDDLELSLNKIAISNNYNTDIKKVLAGLIVQTEKLRPDWRAAACQIRYDGQVNEREGELADSHAMSAIARYACFATMSNVTHANFMNFLDDIEASVSKSPNRGDLDDTAYKVLDTWLSTIDIIDTEEFEEISDSGEFKDREAIIEILVEYLYIPDLLSG